MTHRYFRLILVFTVGFFSSALQVVPPAYGEHAPITARRIMAPGVRWVHPTNRVAVLCEACGNKAGKTPAWLIDLGSGLNALGLEPVLLKHYKAGDPVTKDGFAVILDGWSGGRCMDASGPDSPLRIGFDAPLGTRQIRSLLKRVENELTPDPKERSRVRYLFVVSENSDTSRVLGIQVSWTAWYAKLDADFIRVSDLDSIPTTWLRRYAVVALATDSLARTRTDRLKRRLADYLEHGGGLAVLAGLPDDMLQELAGIRARKGAHRLKGIACDGSWLPGADGLVFTMAHDWDVELADLSLPSNARVLCNGILEDGGKVPAAFIAKRGPGRVVFWQGGQLADKSSRGLILLSLMEASRPTAAAVLNALVFWVDDCPMPMWNAKIPPLDTLYDMTDTQFYEKIWWPKMLSFFRGRGLMPTFGFVLIYDDHVKPPFVSMFHGDDDPATKLGRKVRADGYEVALHGYNHQSLTVARGIQSRGWPGREEMELALRTARQGMIDVLGPDAAPTAYVAPNNMLQKMGKEAVHEVFPEISSMAAQYLDEGHILGQEFGPDPDLPGITDIPRISSEHFLDGSNAYEVLDALVVPGVFSHFVHPDDIRDPERSRGKNFDQMMKAIESMMDRVLGAYPFLTKMSATAFAARVREHNRTGLEVVRGPHSISLRAPGASLEGLTVF
ncbi:MAG: DUF2194 domain-containing protein, partial [Deltaproteobacteria bacterium]|nr:DUF2194 domain-containing protein [Deltaproteobacteria bacterium]